MDQRPLTDADLPAVLALWRRSRYAAMPELEERLGHTPAEDATYFRLHVRPFAQVQVRVVDEVPVAFLALRDHVVSHLYVDPDHYGEGHGSALIAWAKAARPDGLELSTHQANVTARRFYEARGFRAVAFGVSPPPEREPDVLYRWLP